MQHPWLVVRSHPISFHVDARVPAVCAILAIAAFVTIVISVGQGEYPVPLPEVVKAIFGLPVANPDYSFVVQTLRLPRTLVAFLVGAAFAIAGTITQGITRNPLAAPDIIGVNAGAALAATVILVLFPAVSVALLPLAALSGGFGVAVLIYLLAWKQGSSPVRLILVGVGFNLIAGSLVEAMTTFGDINIVSQALVWLAGSVYGRSWEQIIALLPWLCVFAPLALLTARELNTLNLGDDIARSIGSPVEWRRGFLTLTSVALAAAAVATVGSIGFVDLMAPHLSRHLVGPSHEGLIPTAALMGGLIVVLADLVGRLLFAPIEVPCGIITSAIGAPYFLYLLVRSRQS